MAKDNLSAKGPFQRRARTGSLHKTKLLLSVLCSEVLMFKIIVYDILLNTKCNVCSYKSIPYSVLWVRGGIVFYVIITNRTGNVR